MMNIFWPKLRLKTKFTQSKVHKTKSDQYSYFSGLFLMRYETNNEILFNLI